MHFSYQSVHAISNKLDRWVDECRRNSGSNFFCVPSDRKKNKDYIEEEEKKK
jgi:hypothetical protein